MQSRLNAGQGVPKEAWNNAMPSLNPAPSTPRGVRRFGRKSKVQQDRAVSIRGRAGTKGGV